MIVVLLPVVAVLLPVVGVCAGGGSPAHSLTISSGPDLWLLEGVSSCPCHTLNVIENIKLIRINLPYSKLIKN